MPYDIAKRVLQDLPDFATKQKKYEADVAAKIDWRPTFSRIKILPDPEQISSVIDAMPGRVRISRKEGHRFTARRSMVSHHVGPMLMK